MPQRAYLLFYSLASVEGSSSGAPHSFRGPWTWQNSTTPLDSDEVRTAPRRDSLLALDAWWSLVPGVEYY